MTNIINPKKLLHSKFTAVTPVNKEKHFMVTRVKYNDEGAVVLCVLEAVLTKREESIDWQQLKDASCYKPGWC